MHLSKHSRQRDLVLKILRASHNHPTAEWIYEESRKELPGISLGTVYRNLNFLAERGKIRRFNFAGVTRYDGDLRVHYHVRCINCGSVSDIPYISHRVETREIETLTGYQIHGHQLTFSGICPECRTKEEP